MSGELVDCEDVASLSRLFWITESKRPVERSKMAVEPSSRSNIRNIALVGIKSILYCGYNYFYHPNMHQARLKVSMVAVKGDSVAVCSVLLDLTCSLLCDDIEFT